MRSGQRSCERAEPVHASVTLCQGRCRVKGGRVLMALDVDSDSATLVIGNLRERFGDRFRAEWPSLVPRFWVGVEMLKPGREDARRLPGLFQMPEYPV